MLPRKFKYASVKVTDKMPPEGFTTKDLDTANDTSLVHLLNRVLRDIYPDGVVPSGLYSISSSKKMFKNRQYELQICDDRDPSFVSLRTIPNRLT